MKNRLVVLMLILILACLSNVSASFGPTYSGSKKFIPLFANVSFRDDGIFSVTIAYGRFYNYPFRIEEITLKNTIEDVECVVDTPLPLEGTCQHQKSGVCTIQLEATSCTKQTPEIESYAHEIQVNITYTLLHNNTTYQESGIIRHLYTDDYKILEQQHRERMKRLPETLLFFGIFIFLILTHFRIKYKKNRLMRIVYVIYFVFWMLAIIISHILTDVSW